MRLVVGPCERRQSRQLPSPQSKHNTYRYVCVFEQCANRCAGVQGHTSITAPPPPPKKKTLKGEHPTSMTVEVDSIKGEDSDAGMMAPVEISEVKVIVRPMKKTLIKDARSEDIKDDGIEEKSTAESFGSNGADDR